MYIYNQVKKIVHLKGYILPMLSRYTQFAMNILGEENSQFKKNNINGVINIKGFFRKETP